MTNEVRVLVLVLTNWVTIQGTLHRDEWETNYSVKQWVASVETNVVEEVVTPVVTYHTNRTVIRSSREVFERTNTVVRWNSLPTTFFAPFPGIMTKE